MQANQKYCTYDPSTKILSGRKHIPIYNTEANLGYLILHRLIQQPQLVFQVSDDTGVELTNFEIYNRAIKFAEYFSKSIGLKQGDVVGVIASNSENLISIMFACFTLGLAVNPLAIIMDESDICYMWNKTRPKLIFSDSCIIERVKSAVDKMELGAKIFTMVSKVDGFPLAEEILDVQGTDFEFPDLPDISSTNALILCSSGTTNAPKGICKSHKQLISEMIPATGFYKTSRDIFLVNTMSYWISYWHMNIVAALYGAKVVITSHQITPDLFMDIVDTHKITETLLHPVFATIILTSKNVRPMQSMRNIVVGGVPFNEKLLSEIKLLFPNANIRCTYAFSELNIISILATEGTKGTSSGYPFKNVKIKIINEEGHALEPNEVGEICCQKSVPFLGYFRDDESYKNTFDGAGFMKTGDIGYFDDEGHLYVLDRINHMIKTQNKLKIVPMHIEEVINQIDGVIQSCVVGIFDQNLKYDVTYAYVIKDKVKTDLTEEYVKNFVKDRNSDYKRITGGVVFVDALPKTPTGKILYRKVRNMAKELHVKNQIKNKKEKFMGDLISE